MSLAITGMPIFPCPHCGTTLRTAGVPVALAAQTCHDCNKLVHVPARLGDICLTARLGQHPAGDIFSGREDLSGRPLNVLVCHPPEGKLQQVVDATVTVYRRLALATGTQLVRIYRIGFMQDHPVIVTEPHTPSLLNLSRSKMMSKMQVRAHAHTVVQALKAAHQADLRHLGLHPGSVLMRPEGLRVQGFSPWNLLDRPPGRHWKNLYPATWVPPEVEAGAKPDFRSDVWSVGGLLLYLAARKAPGGVEAPEAVLKRLRSDLSPGFVTGVKRLLAADPAKRPDSWAEVLELILPGSAAHAGASAKAAAAGAPVKNSADSTLAFSASSLMNRIKEEERITSTLCGLSHADLGLGVQANVTPNDHIRSLAIDDKGRIDMAADEMEGSSTISPIDIMTRKVVDGEEDPGEGSQDIPDLSELLPPEDDDK